MSTQTPPDDDVPVEIDFAGGTLGKFYRRGATLNLPVYLDAEVQAEAEQRRSWPHAGQIFRKG